MEFLFCKLIPAAQRLIAHGGIFQNNLVYQKEYGCKKVFKMYTKKIIDQFK